MLEDIKVWFKGIRRSWTMWFAAIVATWPVWEPYLGNITGDWTAAVIAIVMVVLRFKTTESITVKGVK